VLIYVESGECESAQKKNVKYEFKFAQLKAFITRPAELFKHDRLLEKNRERIRVKTMKMRLRAMIYLHWKKRESVRCD
jgi:hypothetical protein